MSNKISETDLRRARKAIDAAIQAGRERSAAEFADHVLTLAAMKVAEPDVALKIAHAYALRRGFTETAKKIANG